MTAVRKIRDDIAKMSLRRLKHEGKDKDKRLSEEGDAYY